MTPCSSLHLSVWTKVYLNQSLIEPNSVWTTVCLNHCPQLCSTPLIYFTNTTPLFPLPVAGSLPPNFINGSFLIVYFSGNFTIHLQPNAFQPASVSNAFLLIRRIGWHPAQFTPASKQPNETFEFIKPLLLQLAVTLRNGCNSFSISHTRSAMRSIITSRLRQSSALRTPISRQIFSCCQTLRDTRSSSSLPTSKYLISKLRQIVTPINMILTHTPTRFSIPHS